MPVFSASKTTAMVISLAMLAGGMRTSASRWKQHGVGIGVDEDGVVGAGLEDFGVDG